MGTIADRVGPGLKFRNRIFSRIPLKCKLPSIFTSTMLARWSIGHGLGLGCTRANAERLERLKPSEDPISPRVQNQPGERNRGSLREEDCSPMPLLGTSSVSLRADAEVPSRSPLGESRLSTTSILHPQVDPYLRTNKRKIGLTAPRDKRIGEGGRCSGGGLNG